MHLEPVTPVEYPFQDKAVKVTRYAKIQMRRLKSMVQAQRFGTLHAAVQELFNLDRHLVRAEQYRNLRTGAFREWSGAVA